MSPWAEQTPPLIQGSVAQGLVTLGEPPSSEEPPRPGSPAVADVPPVDALPARPPRLLDPETPAPAPETPGLAESPASPAPPPKGRFFGLQAKARATPDAIVITATPHRQ